MILRNSIGPTGPTKGYTLIELTVVIFLIGLMFALAIPRFRSAILTDNLKTTVRKMVGTIRELRNEAIREHKDHALYFDLESNLFWIISATMSEEERMLAHKKAFSIPKGVRIMDICFKGRGKIMTGETAIRFNKKGYVQQSIIHLGSEDDREFTLILNPFLRRIDVLEKYVDFEST